MPLAAEVAKSRFEAPRRSMWTAWRPKSGCGTALNALILAKNMIIGDWDVLGQVKFCSKNVIFGTCRGFWDKSGKLSMSSSDVDVDPWVAKIAFRGLREWGRKTVETEMGVRDLLKRNNTYQEHHYW